MFGFINNSNFKQKMVTLISFFVVFFLLTGVYSFVVFNKYKVSSTVYKEIISGKDVVADILPPPEYILESYLVVFQMENETDKAKLDDLINRIGQLKRDYDDRHSYWSSNLPEGELKNSLVNSSYAPAIDFFNIVEKQYIPAIQSGDKSTAASLLNGPIKQKYTEQRLAIDNTVKIADALNKNLEEQAGKAITTSTYMLGFILLFGLALVLITSIVMYRSISRSLKSAIRDAGEGTNQVASASRQLSGSSQQLAEANSKLAESIEETSASLEETLSMVAQNSENTEQAAKLTLQAKSSADRGNLDMQDMMQSMSEIRKSSDQIAKIIKVIDEIAFQTNILALNAAVEAARAGDAGMGFAVVAEEVRNLAQRSAQAAKDTSEIIEGNIELSKKGYQVSQKVAQSLSEIMTQAKDVSDLMNSISESSLAQSEGVYQISKAITEMEKVTQQNASNAEEVAAASEELNAQAESLKEVVGELAKVIRGNSASAGNYGRNYKSLPNRGIQTYKGLNSAPAKRTAAPLNPKNTARRLEDKNNARTHIVNPEDVIPLEDDMSDF